MSDDGIIRLGELTPATSRWLDRVVPASGPVLANAVTLDVEYGMVVSGTHDQKIHLFELRENRLSAEVEVPVNEGPVNCVRVAHHPGYAVQVFAACYSGAIVRVDRGGCSRQDPRSRGGRQGAAASSRGNRRREL